MKERTNTYNYLFAAGGTGGHLYPALAVADTVRRDQPGSKILFVGTKKKLESRVVPESGYDFKSIWISGFSRRFNMNNLLFPLKVIVSGLQSFLIAFKFKPDVTIGSGAYVAGPVIWAASLTGSKIVLMEQNSYPGITNRMLEKKADIIFISYEGSKKYFRNSNKLRLSGNPVRFTKSNVNKEEALAGFGLDKSKKTILILGGSLGAASINLSIKENLDFFKKSDLQLIWQTGEIYYDRYKHLENGSVKIFPFMNNMPSAYSASDLVLARAGATTIAELSALGLAVIFVPSPNVAADHQTKNAEEFVQHEAAFMIKDSKLSPDLKSVVSSIIFDDLKLEQFRKNIKKFAKLDAADEVARGIKELAESNLISGKN